ncbi:hypothetical protein [Petrachloros mirabilis]
MSMAAMRLHEALGRLNGKFWRSAGMAGFAFFFIKGLLWLLFPLTWYVMK